MKRPSEETRAWLKSLAETPMDEAEFLTLVDAPMSEEEREDALALIDWFTRRYPTASDRLSYARRAYRRASTDRE